MASTTPFDVAELEALHHEAAAASQWGSTSVNSHAHSEAIEEDLPSRATALQVPNADCAGHVMLCQLDRPLLLQQPLLDMQTVPHLQHARSQELPESCHIKI